MPDHALRKSLQIYKGLVEVSGLINSITDYGELLRAILDVARRVFRAEAASLFLMEEGSGDLVLAIATRGENGFVEPKLSVPRGRGIAGWVLEHGQPLVIPDAYQDERFFKEADQKTGFRTRSILCVPLKRDAELIGVLQILNPCEKEGFDEGDLDGFCAYANLTATAIEKLRTAERMRAQERVERDIAIAAEIQHELLSRAIPSPLSGAGFAAHNTPAANVGGDFYGVFPGRNGEIYFAVGDVSGKGISASLLMAQTLSAMRFVFADETTPSDALARLNETLQASVIRGMFITTLVGKMNLKNHQIELASAGHCLPLVVRSDGPAAKVELRGALPVGILPGVSYTSEQIAFRPGDRLVVYTDGLSESRQEGTDVLFDEFLLPVASGPASSNAELLERILLAEKSHRGSGRQLDDLTVLVGGFE